MAEWPCCHDPLRFSPLSLRFVPPPIALPIPPRPFARPDPGVPRWGTWCKELIKHLAVHLPRETWHNGGRGGAGASLPTFAGSGHLLNFLPCHAMPCHQASCICFGPTVKISVKNTKCKWPKINCPRSRHVREPRATSAT